MLERLNLPEDLVRIYEEKVDVLDEKTAEYLIKTSGCSLNDPDEKLRNALIFGIKDELSAYTDIEKLLKK